MRMRKKKNGPSRLLSCGNLVISEPNLLKGKWKSVFENSDSPIHIEVGCGKGGFIYEMAKKYPDINFIAVEVLIDVMVLAAEKAKADNLTNVKYILSDARSLCEYFDDGEVSRLYLNFSDPWHKNRHFKRRLTYKDFLSIYKTILSKDGGIFLKTDNRNFFEFSLNSFCENDWKLKNITLDLHNSVFNENNVMTEYEKLFSEKGNPIYRLEAYYLS